MSKFHDRNNIRYQEESEDSDSELEYPVQKDFKKERYNDEDGTSNILNKEEYEKNEEEEDDDDDIDEKDIEEEDTEEEDNEEDIDEEDTENEDTENEDTENEEFNDWEDYWGNNPYLEFIDLDNQQEIFCDVNEQNNRFVMLGDSLASGGAYEYYNNDGSYYSQRADGSIVRRDKFGRERITPPEENPRMGRRYRPY
ncbi:hypothetical protein RhiirC2_776530 [Rhizophagus irregularis]|uniref:Uncharacterized protein n=1 Tax=Rhizophagus irregularis TaxID=588596 RepID=A0A2N1NGH5_9GLOM|nr:hypothetical protein RhiirC2_776530 [Rhizophagus irregularis]